MLINYKNLKYFLYSEKKSFLQFQTFPALHQNVFLCLFLIRKASMKH